jgi:uncharacterized membrane protein YgdD (TMEM256/DUF423 family)
MTKLLISLGSLNAAFAVIMGAFGAHALSAKIAPEALATFQTGVHYHFYHSLGLIVIGIVSRTAKPSTALSVSGWTMLTGIFLFSGSLYLISITGIRSIGIVTPFGGILFILSWVLLAIASFKQKTESANEHCTFD